MGVEARIEVAMRPHFVLEHPNKLHRPSASSVPFSQGPFPFTKSIYKTVNVLTFPPTPSKSPSTLASWPRPIRIGNASLRCRRWRAPVVETSPGPKIILLHLYFGFEWLG